MSTLNVNNIAPVSGSDIGVAYNIITRPIFKDYGETVNVIGSIGGGSINYETGEFRLNNCPPNDHFVVSATYSSAHSGGTELTTNGHNVISQIGARCVNQKTNTNIRLLSFN